MESSSNRLTALSLTSSIEWDDSEGILMAGTGVFRTEDVVRLHSIDMATVCRCRCVNVCHIANKDSVPNVIVHDSLIHFVWFTPRDVDRVHIAFKLYVSNWPQLICVSSEYVS